MDQRTKPWIEPRELGPIRVNVVMKETELTNWYGVRSVYLFGQKNDGTNVFEERVVVFSGKSAEEALLKAQDEADQYAKDCDIEKADILESYQQDGDPLKEGVEVWSTLLETDLDMKEFIAQRYDCYAYKPDP